MPFCGDCGSPLRPGAAYCGSCGSAAAGKEDTAQLSPGQGQAVQLIPLTRGMRVPAGALRAAAALGAASAVLVVAGLTLVCGVVAVLLAPAELRGAPADWARAAVALLALTVHAPVRAVADGNVAGLAAGDLASSFTVTPLLLTALLCAAVFWLARSRGPAAPDGRAAQLITLAAAAAAAFAAAAGAAAAAAEGPLSLGGEAGTGAVRVTVGPAPGATALWAFALVFPPMLGSLLAGHAQARGQQGGPGLRAYLASRLGLWCDDVPYVIVLSAAVVAAAVVAGVAYAASELVQAVLRGGDPAGSGTDADAEAGAGRVRSAVGALVLAAAFLPNLLTFGGGMVMGATARAEAGGSGAVPGLPNADTGVRSVEQNLGLLTGGVPAVAYLCVPLLLAVVVPVGLRYALRELPGTAPTSRWWRFPAAFTALWLGLGVLTRMSVHSEGTAGVLGVEAEAAGAASAGLGLPSLALTAFGWALASRVLSRLIAPALAGAFPRLAARLAGSSAHPQWQLLLAAEVARAGRPQPASLQRAGEALVQGVRPQSAFLGPRPGVARAVVAGSAATLGLTILGVVGYPVVSATVFTPERTVRAYFDALSHGDADEALQQVLPESMPNVDRTLLTSAALADAGVEARIRDTVRDGDGAQVTAEVAGAETTTFLLEQDGRIAGLFPRWRLQSPFSLLEIDVDSGGLPVETAAQVNGVPVPATHGGAAVFPGRYAVELAVDYPLTASAQQVTVSGAGVATVEVTVDLDRDVVAKAQQEVDRYVDGCSRSSAAAPEGCPFSYWSSTLTAADWEVVSYPRITVTPTWGGTSLEVSTEEPGEVHLSGTDAGLFDTHDVDYEESVWVSGKLAVDPGTRGVTFLPSS